MSSARSRNRLPSLSISRGGRSIRLTDDSTSGSEEPPLQTPIDPPGGHAADPFVRDAEDDVPTPDARARGAKAVFLGARQAGKSPAAAASSVVRAWVSPRSKSKKQASQIELREVARTSSESERSKGQLSIARRLTLGKSPSKKRDTVRAEEIASQLQDNAALTTGYEDANTPCGKGQAKTRQVTEAPLDTPTKPSRVAKTRANSQLVHRKRASTTAAIDVRPAIPSPVSKKPIVAPSPAHTASSHIVRWSVVGLQIVLFGPWSMAVGASILLSPELLDTITFAPGYIESMQTLRHWADWTPRHVAAAFVLVAWIWFQGAGVWTCAAVVAAAFVVGIVHARSACYAEKDWDAEIFDSAAFNLTRSPRRLQYWVEWAPAHVFTFLVPLGYLFYQYGDVESGMISIVALVFGVLRAWGSFRVDEAIPLGEDDRQSLYIAVESALGMGVTLEGRMIRGVYGTLEVMHEWKDGKDAVGEHEEAVDQENRKDN